ncbi:sensor histidine kinase [Dictyobacter vulcani]|uniref:sensor histidine kinase n=1 Tax=Dictyobacter vulcani TaxID=2607529 RepID=UPI001387352F|nr:ATP-binding protein [Dictyobacter vulcani]
MNVANRHERNLVLSQHCMAYARMGIGFMDDFISLAVHALMVPLTVWRKFSQMLVAQVTGGQGFNAPAWQYESMAGHERAIMHMTSLRDISLDVKRLQAGKLALNIEPCDLIALARRVVKYLQTTTNKHHFQVRTGLDYLIIMADPFRIEQVLINLLKNATRDSPEGGTIFVDIWEGHESENVRVAALLVMDCGLDMPDKHRAKLFGRFSRIDNAWTLKGEGLSLHLCRALIERQAGYIWVESVEHHGTTFYVTLPVYS